MTNRLCSGMKADGQPCPYKARPSSKFCGVHGTQKKDYQKQADTHFSKYVRLRDGQCQNCGTADNLQCAHLISRRYKSIRTSASNAVALCRSCHVFFTHRPLEWAQWIVDRFGQDYYDRLIRQALDTDLAKSVDWKWEADYWKEQASG